MVILIILQMGKEYLSWYLYLRQGGDGNSKHISKESLRQSGDGNFNYTLKKKSTCI